MPLTDASISGCSSSLACYKKDRKDWVGTSTIVLWTVAASLICTIVLINSNVKCTVATELVQ